MPGAAAGQGPTHLPHRPPIGAPIPPPAVVPPAQPQPQQSTAPATHGYTDIIGAPPPPPPATAPPPAPEHHHVAPPTGAPQPTPEAAAEAAAHPGPQSEIPLDAVLHATRRAADGADPATISSELRLQYGIENPDPIVDRIVDGEGRRP